MKAANDDRIETNEGKVHILVHAIVKMEGELMVAEGPRKRALLKRIRMGRNQLSELRTLH